jgi:addiction module RelE/StbE family toxin
MRIFFHRSLKKRYKKMPIKIRRKAEERILLFADNPSNSILNNHPLTGDRNGQWSINITGDWRAIYVFKNKNEVVFIDIDTHSNLYK